MELLRRQIVGVVFGLFLGFMLGIAAMVYSRQSRPNPILIEPPPPTPLPTPQPTPAPIRIYVSGEVVNPGVYELPASAIFQDAIQAAGGYATNADRDAINLAQPIQNGMQLHAPRVGEGGNGAQTVILPTGESSSENAPQININTATAAELEALPGVGPATAGAIIEYREQNGLFGSIEEITNVRNIGPATFNRLKPLITVE